MKSTNSALAAAALVAVLATAGCGVDDDEVQMATAAKASSTVPVRGAATARHNPADVAFLRTMIPHHEQAVQMAPLADERAGSARVKALSTAIRNAQDPEIQQMRGLLSAWCAPVPDASGPMAGMDHGAAGGGGMEGMMSADQMTRLHDSRGTAFDREFLTMMIAHHEGGVAMARTELADGVNPQARALAQQIADAQQREIADMRGMLARA